MPARQLGPSHEDPCEELAALALGLRPDQLERFASTLDPDDLSLLEQVTASRLSSTWRATPDALAERLTGGRYRRWSYVRLLGEKFADAVEGRSVRQLWLLPAQYGKSMLASQWGPAWALDRYPDRRFILTSYGDELAERNALAVRDILVQHKGALRAQLRRDQARQDRFSTDEGGGVLAAGILSGITGFSADGVVIDDPFKNWQEAHSPARRELVRNQYRSVLRLRLTSDNAFVILVMTRWHPDDLAGWLVAEAEAETGERFEVVRLPEVAETPVPDAADPMLRLADPLGRQPGELLEPERFGPSAVLAKHLALGTYLTAGMAQQRPAPEEGGELKRAWFLLSEGPDLPRRPQQALTAWDLKLKNREEGDYVVGQCWWSVAGGFWLMGHLRGQYDHATTANAIALLAVRHPEVKRHYIEAAGSADEVMPVLRAPQEGYVISDEMARRLGMVPEEREAVERLRQRGMGNLQAVPARGDKSVRARAHIAPQAEAGNVRLRADLPGLAVLLEELASFPRGHDDQVDAMSLALSKLAGGGRTSAKAPRGSLPPVIRPGRLPVR